MRSQAEMINHDGAQYDTRSRVQFSGNQNFDNMIFNGSNLRSENSQR